MTLPLSSRDDMFHWRYVGKVFSSFDRETSFLYCQSVLSRPIILSRCDAAFQVCEIAEPVVVVVHNSNMREDTARGASSNLLKYLVRTIHYSPFILNAWLLEVKLLLQL